MTQTGIPASGMFGPGDYGPDFVTIEGLHRRCVQHDRENSSFAGGNSRLHEMYNDRNNIVDCLLDLAHDLDARGFVLMSTDEVENIRSDGWDEGYEIGRAP